MNTLQTIANWNPLLETIIMHYDPKKKVSHKMARKIGTYKNEKGERRNRELPDDLKELRDTAQTMKLHGKTGSRQLGKDAKRNYIATGKHYHDGEIPSFLLGK